MHLDLIGAAFASLVRDRAALLTDGSITSPLRFALQAIESIPSATQALDALLGIQGALASDRVPRIDEMRTRGGKDS